MHFCLGKEWRVAHIHQSYVDKALRTQLECMGSSQNQEKLMREFALYL